MHFSARPERLADRTGKPGGRADRRNSLLWGGAASVPAGAAPYLYRGWKALVDVRTDHEARKISDHLPVIADNDLMVAFGEGTTE
jgi:hypothetical protein